MRELKGRTALITGASRGIGVPIAEALAREGMRLALAARSADALQSVCDAIGRDYGAHCVGIPTDVSVDAELDALVTETESQLGPIDVLVNNAGIECTAKYTSLQRSDIDRMLQVNVRAPMVLTHIVLPGMLERGRGHIVNIASLAGLAAVAYSEPYCATKHALVGFTRALRASLEVEGSPVGASSICPGYITEAGLYAYQQAKHDIEPAAMAGTSTPAQVAEAVVAAIRRDAPEVVVNPGVPRLMLALNALFPRAAAWLGHKFNLHAVPRGVVESQEA